jgi:pimeloyl-ACP methyl ester carboxylesterase
VSTYVLISGAWHGAWCWERVTPLLIARGHAVRTPELPATGTDTGDPRQVTLAGWARYVAEIVERQREPVILVGHSRGGIVTSQVAELVPDGVRRLVFVAAYLLPHGATLAAQARADAESLIAPNMVPAATGVTCTLRAGIVRDALYGRCSATDADWATARLSPEPLKPLVTPLRLSDARFGRVPRQYIECRADRAVTHAAQRAMQAALPCEAVYTLDADHSPFLSRPAELAQLLSRP